MKNIPLKIEKLETELRECETILNKKNLYENDKETFDKVTNKITKIKRNILEAEDKWLELQILNDKINNT